VSSTPTREHKQLLINNLHKNRGTQDTSRWFVTYLFNEPPENPKIAVNSLIYKYVINILLISPYFPKTWEKSAAKSLIPKDRTRGVSITK